MGTDFGLPDSQEGAVLFVSAHTTRDNTYLNNHNNYDGRGTSLNRLVRLCECYGCKALVMDTPTGSQLSSTVSLDISDVIVTVMRITRQFREGTIEHIRRLDNNYCDKKFVIVPNAVPYVDQKHSNIIDRIFADMRNIFGNGLTNNIMNTDFIKNGLMGINEVQILKLNEYNLFIESKTRELTGDEQSALGKYKQLAEIVCNEEN